MNKETNAENLCSSIQQEDDKIKIFLKRSETCVCGWVCVCVGPWLCTKPTVRPKSADLCHWKLMSQSRVRTAEENLTSRPHSEDETPPTSQSQKAAASHNNTLWFPSHFIQPEGFLHTLTNPHAEMNERDAACRSRTHLSIINNLSQV